MKHGYYFEIMDGLSPYYCFSYIDSEDNLADFLFAQLKIDVEIEMEFHSGNDPYKIIMCRIPRKQREAFLKAVGLLPGLMAYAGKTDYDEFCMDLMMRAGRFIEEQERGGKSIPLQ